MNRGLVLQKDVLKFVNKDFREYFEPLNEFLLSYVVVSDGEEVKIKIDYYFPLYVDLSINPDLMKQFNITRIQQQIDHYEVPNFNEPFRCNDKIPVGYYVTVFITIK